MTRQNATNFTAPLQFPYATAGTDVFMKEDVQILAQAVDQHNHTTGKGLPIAAGAIPNGSITSAMIADGTITGTDIAANTVTSNNILDGTIATADLANAAVTNAKLGTDTARLNLVTNGGFEIWQRGNGPFTVGNAYQIDRWYVGIVGTDTYSLSKDTTKMDTGSNACAAMTFTLGSGGGGSNIQQVLKSVDENLRGLTVSLSVRVRTATANAVRVSLTSDGTGATNVYSSYHAGSGTYQTLTVTYPIPSNATYVNITIYFAASCTVYLDNAMLVVGSVAADYAPLHPADDLARCLRYYERVGDGSEILIAGWSGAASEAIGGFLRWTRKAVTPTVTNSGTWGTVNCNQPVTASGTVAGCQLYTTSTASGHVQFTSSGSAYQTVEANP